MTTEPISVHGIISMIPIPPVSDRKLKLYVDIDGVLFSLMGRDGSTCMNIRPFVTSLLREWDKNFDCQWATVWSRDAIDELSRSIYFPDGQFWLRMPWMDSKIEGLDFSSDFIFIDDDLSHTEIEDFSEKRDNSKIQRIIKVDPVKQDELERVDGLLRETLKEFNQAMQNR
jgi:hypothetical protein